jgi:putative ribosome biogenesis GTPase RsgA
VFVLFLSSGLQIAYISTDSSSLVNIEEMSPTPITVLTGFLGSGKTTLILNLIPQLPPTYKLALLKNEFGRKITSGYAMAQ